MAILPLDTQNRLDRGFDAFEAITDLLSGQIKGALCQPGHLAQLMELVLEDMRKAMPSDLANRRGMNDDDD